MEVLMPVLLVFIIAGFFLYNPVRRKYNGIIGVGGAYLVSIGIILAVNLIAAIFVPSIRESAGGAGAIIAYAVIAVLTILYLVFIMITRCKTVMQRIGLPFAILIMAFGFATRLLGSIFLHLPMENGSTAAAETVQPAEKVEVWRENGMMRENLKVNSSGDMYYDPEDGEWHKIQK